MDDMIFQSISYFAKDDLDRILYIAGCECDTIYLTQVYDKEPHPLLENFKDYVISSEKVMIWDGTIRPVEGWDECGCDISNMPLDEENCALRHWIRCNLDSVDIIKQYQTDFADSIFHVNSEFDIAFYKKDECYFYTTAHENHLHLNGNVFQVKISRKGKTSN